MPFVKRKKRPEISSPTNFEHRVHSGFDHDNGVFVGLPTQWNSIINETTEQQQNQQHKQSLNNKSCENNNVSSSNLLFAKTNGINTQSK
jgi:hypothetical protein